MEPGITSPFDWRKALQPASFTWIRKNCFISLFASRQFSSFELCFSLGSSARFLSSWTVTSSVPS
jgi:hypothetical protein